jgi:hypothetical protein
MEEQNKKIPDVVLGLTLDENAKSALREGKETELLKGFISQKTGKSFDAYISLNSNNNIRFRFPQSVAAKKSFPKSTKVPTKVGGVDLDEEDIEDLKAGRETKLIMGIESKKKGKTYDAYLRWNETRGIIFRFPGQDC